MRKQNGITLLFVVIILFSASFGIMHVGASSRVVQGIKEENSVEVTLNDAIDLLQPLLIARSFDTAAQSIQQFSDTLVIQVLTALINGQGPSLGDDDKIELLLGTVHYSSDNIVRDSIFSMLLTYFSKQPVFYWAMYHDYADVIALIAAWADQYKKNIKEWTLSSLEKSISEDKPNVLDQLYAQGIRCDAAFASRLLSSVVQNKRSVEFVPFLIDRLSADANLSTDGKRTLLMVAVEHNNLDMVKVLLQEGADPKLVLDEHVGSAGQIAHGRKYVAIERALQESASK